jgi:hypothetical protein
VYFEANTVTMKNVAAVVLLLFIVFIVFFVSCTVKLTSKSPNHLPPGQAKKVAGAQSASSFAPGHNKN